MQTHNKDVWSNSFETRNGKLFLSKEAVQQNDLGEYKMFDLEWVPIPGAKSYVITILDYEASRVVGQTFIHWAVANLPSNKIDFGENLTNKTWIQGVNSTVPGEVEGEKGIIIPCVPEAFRAKDFKSSIGYFPPMPPDKKHLYTIKIYGIDQEKLNLENGFFLGELNHELLDHVKGIRTINFWYEQ